MPLLNVLWHIHITCAGCGRVLFTEDDAKNILRATNQYDKNLLSKIINFISNEKPARCPYCRRVLAFPFETVDVSLIPQPLKKVEAHLMGRVKRMLTSEVGEW